MSRFHQASRGDSHRLQSGGFGRRKRAVAVAATSMAALLGAQLERTAHAANNTFTAGSSWNIGTDWSSGAIPASTDALLFNSTNFPATTTLNGNFTADTLSFNDASTMAIDANASGTTAESLTLNNASTDANGTSDMVSLLGGGIVNIGVTTGKGTLTVALGAPASNINVADGGSLVFGANSVISGSSKALSFTGNNTGKLTLAGADTFSGGFTLTSGKVVQSGLTSLGSGPLNLNGGTLDIALGTATGETANNTVVGGNTTILSDANASGSNGFSYLLGTLSIGADTLTVDKGTNITGASPAERAQFAGTTLTGNAVLDAEDGAFLVVGAGGSSPGLSGNFNLTVQSAASGTGAISVRGGVNASTPRSSGVTTFASGKNNINGAGNSDILGTTGTTLALNGGSLDLQVTTFSILAYNTTVGGNFTLTNSQTVTQTLGTLSIGAYNLTTGGSGSSGADNIAFGATTVTGNATFTVTNGTTGATSTLTLGALNDGGTAYTITKAGASTLILNAATANLTANDQINISTGNLSVTNATALGTVAGTGVTVDVADGTVFNVGAATLSVGALTNTTGIHTANTGSVTLGANTLTIGSAGTNLSGAFGGVISGTGSMVKAGTGTETLSGLNTFTGTTAIKAGALSINTIATVGGGSSALGAPTTVSNGTISIGATTVSGALVYTGSAQTTDRVINLAGTTGGATIDQSGTGLLKFISALTDTGTAAVDNRKTLVLQGSTSGTGEIAGAIVDSTNGTTGQKSTSVLKQGTGIWSLSASSTYSGGTTISGGTLRAANINALSTGVVAISGGTLALGTDASTIGSLTTGAETWSSAGGYTAKIANSSGGAGNIDQITMSGLTVSSTSGSPFAITLTAPSATTGFNSASNYDWQIANINAASVSGISTGSILAEADSSGQNITSGFGSEIFTLDTSSFVGANSPPAGSSYFLELEGTPGAYSLDVGYNSTPEPGTMMLVLAGAVPMLSGRRRRRKSSQQPQ